MRDTLSKVLSICIVLLVAVIINSVATLSLTDLGTYDNSPKKMKEVINANNTLTETAVNANLSTATQNAGWHVCQTGATVTATLFTPRFIGDFLLDTADTNLWISAGTTTNDWLQIK